MQLSSAHHPTPKKRNQPKMACNQFLHALALNPDWSPLGCMSMVMEALDRSIDFGYSIEFGVQRDCKSRIGNPEEIQSPLEDNISA